MPKRFKLYYFPTSYYSQKVLITLYEKNVDFDKMLVNITSGEQNNVWYMKINPQGLVPVLVDDDKTVAESEDIVNYIDEHVNTGYQLIPDTGSKPGQAVQKWRERLNALPVGVISYGVFMNPELSITGLQLPKILKSKTSPESVKANLASMKASLQIKADSNPGLRDDYLRKIKELDRRLENFQNKRLVVQHLDDLEKMFDDVEKQLESTRKEQGLKDSWLVGPRFTIADVHLVIILERVFMLGLGKRFLVVTKRPCLCDFFKRSRQRKSVQLIHQGLKSVAFIIMRSRFRQLAAVFGGIFIVGASLCVGVLAYRLRK